MTELALLSAPVRAWVSLWALLLCLTNVGSGVLAAVRRRFPAVALALALFGPGYWMWQVLFDLSLFGRTAAAHPSAALLGALPWLAWLGALALLTAASGLLLSSSLRYDRTHITPGTIKLFLDQIPCGVCCWRESGRVLFSNICMNRLCQALTGSPLLNGVQFRAAVGDGIVPVEGQVWRFSCRALTFAGETLWEMVATDITAAYAKTQALERDKAELSQLNRELRAYYDSLDETIRRREILQAKLNIHEEMNRLMLSTAAAKGEDPAALDRIFALWEQNALLLCRDERAEAQAAESLEKLAAALGVRLIRTQTPPGSLSERQRSLLRSAAQEALVNAVKHGAAKTMTLSWAEGEDGLRCRFTNDGAPPASPLRFTGGLANLALLARQEGAEISAGTDQGFTLELYFPRQEEPPCPTTY